MNQSNSEAGERVSRSPVDLLGEISARLSQVEAENRQMREEWNSVRERGEAGTLDVAHVNHVMMKHFPHDRPDERSESERGG